MFLKKWWHLSILHRIFHVVELTFPSCLNRADAKNLLVCLFTVMFISCLIKTAWNLEIVFLHLDQQKNFETSEIELIFIRLQDNFWKF